MDRHGVGWKRRARRELVAASSSLARAPVKQPPPLLRYRWCFFPPCRFLGLPQSFPLVSLPARAFTLAARTAANCAVASLGGFGGCAAARSVAGKKRATKNTGASFRQTVGFLSIFALVSANAFPSPGSAPHPKARHAADGSPVAAARNKSFLCFKVARSQIRRKSSSTPRFLLSTFQGKSSGLHVVSPSQVLVFANKLSEAGAHVLASAASLNSVDWRYRTATSDPVSSLNSVTKTERRSSPLGRSSSRRSVCATAAHPAHAIAGSW
mmetsp:Transcript_12606/g.47115  ORF Transcript_12606/g.47115 Transcript_12606/m.47115 type:complete len:268 (+) Transcript_12606:3234-4037(+)